TRERNAQVFFRCSGRYRVEPHLIPVPIHHLIRMVEFCAIFPPCTRHPTSCAISWPPHFSPSVSASAPTSTPTPKQRNLPRVSTPSLPLANLSPTLPSKAK